MGEMAPSPPVLYRTNRFSSWNLFTPKDDLVVVQLCCPYSKRIVLERLNDGPKCTVLHEDSYEALLKSSAANFKILQFSDFESINWESVLNGSDRASSYLVRKGLSRKAQFSLQLKKYTCKKPASILHRAIPFTLILDVWGAFDDMKFDFGGGTFASFDNSFIVNTPLRNKLEFVLEDIRDSMHDTSRQGWCWILKPSVVNKGLGISLLYTWEQLLDALEDASDIREWVLQRYIPQPLLINGHKFHIRTYILCIGALRVYVFEEMLLLIAAHPYDERNYTDIYAHLTNTARAAETVNFQEEKYVQLLSDLPRHIKTGYPHLCQTAGQEGVYVDSVRSQIREITHDVFCAYENEYTIFCPMANCFELYGLDFIVDEAMNVSLLEVNPGPDFKQTGARLEGVIHQLFRDTIDLVVRGENSTKAMTEVYNKEWSISSQVGGMKMA